MTEKLSKTELNAIRQLYKNSPKPKKRKRWLKTILIVLAFLVLLFVGNIWIMNMQGRQAVERALAEAREIDPLLTYEEIEAARPTWPPGKNGADIIIEITDELKTISDEAVKVELLPIMGKGETPPLGHRWDATTHDVVAAELEKRADVLRKIDQLKQYEGGRFPLDIPDRLDLTDSSFPPLRGNVRSSIKLKGTQFIYRVMCGDTSRVIDDMEVMIKITQLIADEPFLVSALTWTACEAFSISLLQDVCALCILQPDQIETISAQLAKLDKNDRWRWATLGERAYNLMFWSSLYGPPACTSNETRVCVPWDHPRNLVSGMYDKDKAYGIEVLNLAVKAGQDSDQALQIAEEILDRCENAPFYATLSRITLPSLHKAFELDARSIAVNRSARVALAAERYRIDTGDWPENLQQLVPKYIAAIPIDPFDRQPLKFARSDDAFVVYSIGDDRNDDGGDVGLTPSTYDSQGNRVQQKDWGFALLHPSKRNQAPTSQPRK